MKFNSLLTLAALVLTMTIFSCDNSTKEKVTDAADDITDIAILGDKIGKAEANAAVNQYNTLYGGEDVYRFLAKDNESGSVILPRFYTVNRTDFIDLLKNSFAETETFYASLAIVDKTYSFPQTASGEAHLADLIFHKHRPYSDGYLKNKGADDTFFDNAKPCPTDCNPGTGNNSGDEIDLATANTRINNYNKLYGSEIQYMTANTPASDKSVTIARYYAISRTDFLGVLTSSDAENLYVSLAANQLEGNIYQADLILHEYNPGPQGGLSSTGGEDFFDFSVPCPDECDTSSLAL